MSYTSPALRDMEWERKYPYRVRFKRFRQAVEDGRAPKRASVMANSRVVYRNVDSDYTLEVGFVDAGELLVFTSQWKPDQLRCEGQSAVMQYNELPR